MFYAIFLGLLVATYFVTMAVTGFFGIAAFVRSPAAAIRHPSGGSWLVSWLGWFVAGNFIVFGML